MTTRLRLRQIWESGVRMREAWRTYAPDQALAALEHRPELKIPSGIENSQPTGWGTGLLIVLSAIAIGVRQTQSHLERERAICDALKDGLLDRLWEGELVAYGFRLTSRSPQRISQDFFFELDEIDWEEESARFRGTEFEKLRILAAQSIPEEFRPKRIGRPRADPIILKALEIAAARHHHFFQLDYARAKGRVMRIMSELDASYPENKHGRSDKTVEKYLSLYRTANRA